MIVQEELECNCNRDVIFGVNIDMYSSKPGINIYMYICIVHYCFCFDCCHVIVRI